MAGLTSLVAGGAKSLLKDRASAYMSPQQMELAQFALSPQAYLADKGIAAVANLLGYGKEYQNLKSGAQAEKDYFKETIQDTLGDVLPESIGQYVRSTPKGTDAPSGTYWDPETQSWQQSGSPVAQPDQFASDRFAGLTDINSSFNPSSQTFMGPNDPASMDSTRYGDNVKDLYEMLGQYQQPSGANTRSLSSQPPDNQVGMGYRFDPNTGTAVPIEIDTQAGPGYTFDPNTGTAIPIENDTQAGPGYTFDPNIGMMVPMQNVTSEQAPPGYQFNSNSGMNEPIDFGGTMDYGDMFGGGVEQADDFGKYGLGVSYFGGGGEQSLEQFDMDGYKHGGQICGCKR